MICRKHTVFFIVIVSISILQAYIGQSAIITLSFPFGARLNGMGEIGTALADDESCVFWNPAGLGRENKSWYGGAATQFYEPLLPAFDIPDLWHMAIAACYQPAPSSISKVFDPGGFGFFFNYLNFGENIQYDAQGKLIATFNSYEYVAALAWGFNFAEFGIQNLSAGLTLKYANSILAPGIGEGSEGTARTIAIDAGLLYCFPFGLRIGFTLQNMGPSVYYISKENSDPIPFTGLLALGYKNEIIRSNLRILRVCAEYNLNKEMVKNDPYEDPEPFWKAMFTSWTDQPINAELSEIIHNFGFETTFFNTGSCRIGLLMDNAGSRKELHLGFGKSILNHFNWDWYYIHSPKRSIARDGQWGISFTFKSLFHWSKNDLRWWEVSGPN